LQPSAGDEQHRCSREHPNSSCCSTHASTSAEVPEAQALQHQAEQQQTETSVQHLWSACTSSNASQIFIQRNKETKTVLSVVSVSITLWNFVYALCCTTDKKPTDQTWKTPSTEEHRNTDDGSAEWFSVYTANAWPRHVTNQISENFEHKHSTQYIHLDNAR